MNRTQRFAGLIMLAALGTSFTSAEVAAQPFVITNGAGWQTTTGVGGSYAPRDFVAPAGMALVGIQYGEDRDIPCYYRFTWWRPGASSQHSEWNTYSACSGNQKRYVGVTPSTQAPRVLRLVRVCNRGSNDRIKGVRVRGANVNAHGAQRDPGLLTEHDRPNCNNNWSPRISQCPAGQAITRVRVETKNTGTYQVRSAVGLSVFCSRVRTSS